MTSAIRRSTGARPLFCSQRPNTLARCTSHAARSVQAPSRKYSCSTLVERPGAGASVGCLRRRAGITDFFVRRDDECTRIYAFRGRPCQRRSYRSRMRLALAAKSGSHGRIQRPCRQGRRASALSPRHKVAPLISATNPWVSTSRRISERESRESGSCKRCGSSQASA
jgi:hypothetical protein